MQDGWHITSCFSAQGHYGNVLTHGNIMSNKIGYIYLPVSTSLDHLPCWISSFLSHASISVYTSVICRISVFQLELVSSNNKVLAECSGCTPHTKYFHIDHHEEPPWCLVHSFPLEPCSCLLLAHFTLYRCHSCIFWSIIISSVLTVASYSIYT